jgi:hypothetical protein
MSSNIATAINAEHEAVQAAVKESVRHALECGKLLSEAKATVAHGGWNAWLVSNCRFSARTAQLYMKLAEHAASDPAKAQRVADLSLREAARQMSKHRLSPLTKAELEDMLDAWDAASTRARDRFLSHIGAADKRLAKRRKADTP